MLLYLSSSIYIFAALEISLPYPGVVSIYRGEMVWGCEIAYSKDPTGILLDSGRLAV